MRQFTIALAILIALPCLAQPRLPADPGESVPLAQDDYELTLGETQTLRFIASEGLGDRQIVLAFRARIDALTTVGSTNMIAIAVNDTAVLLRNARREVRLLNKPDTFAWTNPPELTWYLRQGQWRLAYAPDPRSNRSRILRPAGLRVLLRHKRPRAPRREHRQLRAHRQ